MIVISLPLPSIEIQSSALQKYEYVDSFAFNFHVGSAAAGVIAIGRRVVQSVCDGAVDVNEYVLFRDCAARISVAPV